MGAVPSDRHLLAPRPLRAAFRSLGRDRPGPDRADEERSGAGHQVSIL
jgi:hypothetical protein